ncbi:unnamed protein product [Polarella glacialis]|uniref:AAA+ ATPase domain-containing protein n=1 Tax=Polarella glacialis TaxID=89957 RepID=A0A813FXN2_POLGL|nr:unnamed protein product [Polarella glacialis]
MACQLLRSHSPPERPRRSRLGPVVFAGVLCALCALFYAPATSTAAVNLTGSTATPAAGRENSTASKPIWILPLEIELRHKRWRRIKLIRILNEVSQTRKYSTTALHLEQQGPDGSRLVQPEREDGISNKAQVGSRPPPELFQLLQVEDRIRQLRHLRRIARARQAAARSSQKLAELRQPPLKRALAWATQAAGAFTIVRALHHVARDMLEDVTFRVPSTMSKVSRGHAIKEGVDATPGPAELRAMWEVAQPLVDAFWQALALRAIRGKLTPQVAGLEAHVPDVSLEDVAGIGSAKAEALEIVECLMAPARFASLGAKCPKGLLLTGPPGCGKTLLAKAIASTAAVPFISRSGADFNGRFAGTGTQLVKELFRVARSMAPAVILIDELDYIGRRRGEERGGGLETDRSAALTQLLAEMDGFNSAEGVVVIGTTNRPDILDKALTRPGRFDRKVTVPLPDLLGRHKIIRTHAQRLALEDPSSRRLTGADAGAPVDWMGWAKRTPGFSGADLAGLVNEAAMAAAREGALGVGERHVQAAYSKSLTGVPSGRHPSAAEMELTASHEAGHAVVNEAMRASLGAQGLGGFRTVAHISIVPAGGTGGVTQFAEPDEGKRLPESRRVLIAELAVAMGGRAAEELETGEGEATMGARSDIDMATRMATDMVAVGGLSEVVGPRSLNAGMNPSQELMRQVDEEVNKLLRKALVAARAALGKNRALHAALTKELIQRETLDGEAFRHLVEQHQVSPVPL